MKENRFHWEHIRKFFLNLFPARITALFPLMLGIGMMFGFVHPVSGDELIVNGSFETGDLSGWNATAAGDNPFRDWSVSPLGEGGGYTTLAKTRPQDGQYVVWNGFEGDTLEFFLFQNVTIPTFPGTATRATLSWQHRIQWNFVWGNKATEERTFSVEIRDVGTNDVIETLYSFGTGTQDENPTGDTGWEDNNVDLSAYAGQTVRITFREIVPEDSTGPGQVELDAISLQALPNADPVITLPSGASVDYDENGGPVYLDQQATVTDSDNVEFNGGQLTVAITENGTVNDSLTILSEGTGSKQISVSGSTVSYSGVPFATYTGGSGTTPLVFTFNSSAATPGAAQALIRRIQYSNSSRNPSLASRSVQFTVTDGDGGTSNQPIKIVNMIGQNDAPVAVDDAYNGNEGEALTIAADQGVLINDTDIENDSLSAVLVDVPVNGTVTLNADGSFTYTHDGSETTSDSFTYMANDGIDNSNVATVSLTITPVNDAPLAVADSYTVEEGEALTVDAANGVLANDTDAEGNAFTAVLISQPANGTLTFNADGSFTYVHAGVEGDTDSFSYRAQEESGIGTDTVVTITVTPRNDAPVAAAESYTVDEGETLTVDAAQGVLANDSDVENDPLTAVLVTEPVNGALTLNADGSFSYEHDGSETTSDSFAYAPNDGSENGNTVTVSITVNPVNDAPVAVEDTYSVNEGETLNVAATEGVLANDTDAENDALTAVLVEGPTSGQLTLNADGSFSYVHDGSEVRGDSFTYRADEAGGLSSNVATVNISVTPQNDDPVANDDAYQINEGETLVAEGNLSVLTNDTDAESDPLTAAVVTEPANGTLTFNADGTFTYTHDGSETVADSFTYRANDGTVDSNVATVTITVNPVNDAPVAVADSYSVDEGAILAITADQGVLANDTDAENDALTATVLTAPANGTLTLNADGSFTYTHDGSETTEDSFTYTANDGNEDSEPATVSITINPVNDAPIVNNDAYQVNEGATLEATSEQLSVLNNDSDADGDTLTATLVTQPAHGTLTLNADGTFTYVHDGSEEDSDSFTYNANDGTTDGETIGTVTISIVPVNDAPVAVAASYTVDEGGTLDVTADQGVLANDTDAEGTTLTASLVDQPVNGTLVLNSDGSFTYVHDGSETTSDSFTYTASDGETESEAVTVTLTINPVNDVPVATIDGYLVDEGATLTVTAEEGVLANDTDAEEGDLTAILVSEPQNGTLTFANDGSFIYEHDGEEDASDFFTYRASDGTDESEIVTVGISITPVNDAPVAVADKYKVDEGKTLSRFASLGVLANDTDAENDPLSAILVTDPVNGELTLNSDGSFTYVHDGSETSRDSFTYKNSDGELESATARVSIQVSLVNDAPINILPASQTVIAGGELIMNATNENALNVSDVDAQDNPVEVMLWVDNGLLTLSRTIGLSFIYGNGSLDTGMIFKGKMSDINAALNEGLIYYPKDGFSGQDVLTFTTDDQGNTGAGREQFDTDELIIVVTEEAAVTPTPTPAVTNPVYITDELIDTTDINKEIDPDDLRDLSGEVDYDTEEERAMAIKWNLNLRSVVDVHIYVRVNGGDVISGAKLFNGYYYLGRTADGSARQFNFAPSARLLAKPFVDGPQFGNSYEFRVYLLKIIEGKFRASGPYEHAAPVFLAEEGTVVTTPTPIPQPTSTPLPVVDTSPTPTATPEATVAVTPTPTATPGAETAVTVTDDVGSTADLSNDQDTDSQDEVSLVIRWDEIDPSNVFDIHVYVKPADTTGLDGVRIINGYYFLGQTKDPAATLLNWTPDSNLISLPFRNGPVSGESYEFRVYVIEQVEGQYQVRKPISNAGPVSYVIE